MPQLRLALNQIDSTLGDLARNAEAIVHWTRHAVGQGAHLVAFPEMALTGRPVEGLALRPSFVEASREAVRGLAVRLDEEGFGHVPVVVGHLGGYIDGDLGGDLGRESAAAPGKAAPSEASPSDPTPARAPQNSAAVLHRGAVALAFAKHHLPDHGALDEFRHFVPGDTLPVVRVHGVDVALAIGQDLQQDGGRASAARSARAGLLLSLHASPYQVDEHDSRLDLVRGRAREAGCTTAYVAMTGGQDELVFAGDSLVCDKDGEVIARAPQFSEGCMLLDLDLPAASDDARTGGVVGDGLRVERAVLSEEPLFAYDAELLGGYADRLEDPEEIYTALVVGLRGYTAKNGFRSVLLGLSDGIGSALLAALACDAVGARHVYGVSMPSRPGSARSGDAATELARRTRLNLRTVDMGPLLDAYQGALRLTGAAEENLRLRLRGTLLRAIADQEGHLVLAPGNKSELAVGRSTLLGDWVGAYAPVKDVYRTCLFELARWRNRAAEKRGQVPPIPDPPAEHHTGSLTDHDADPLPADDVLDRILELYLDRDHDLAAVVAAGFDREVVARTLRAVDSARHRRHRYPPGTKISPQGRGRRLPVTHRWSEPPG